MRLIIDPSVAITALIAAILVVPMGCQRPKVVTLGVVFAFAFDSIIGRAAKLAFEGAVFKPMLYELLSGEVDVWKIAPRFSDLLTNTGTVQAINVSKSILPSAPNGNREAAMKVLSFQFASCLERVEMLK
ncbi:unnamed protein product [Eruca vesicaria subsp. sativa]|uniref:Uncharacterized protein n=1 Tax=Eruca vesicaria subsp. sativa TaxID=29727 RepID=A0ABC8M2G2_ERUVS|nr:unnamed protein product [Eruca vesicaria subsp. sativa]